MILKSLYIDYSDQEKESIIHSYDSSYNFSFFNSDDIKSFMLDFENVSSTHNLGDVIILDLNSLRHDLTYRLLKFIENYGGSLVIFVKDPVPSPLLSRCNSISKKFKKPNVINYYDIKFQNNTGKIIRDLYENKF